MDASIVFTKIKEFFPQAKEIENITILQEFTELAYKDDEMDVKFEFTTPHTVKITYQGGEFVYISDDEFDITVGNRTEDEAILDYICYLDFYWDRYVEGEITNISKKLKEKIEKIKSKVKKL